MHPAAFSHHHPTQQLTKHLMLMCCMRDRQRGGYHQPPLPLPLPPPLPLPLPFPPGLRREPQDADVFTPRGRSTRPRTGSRPGSGCPSRGYEHSFEFWLYRDIEVFHWVADHVATRGSPNRERFHAVSVVGKTYHYQKCPNYITGVRATARTLPNGGRPWGARTGRTRCGSDTRVRLRLERLHAVEDVLRVSEHPK